MNDGIDTRYEREQLRFLFVCFKVLPLLMNWYNIFEIESGLGLVVNIHCKL